MSTTDTETELDRDALLEEFIVICNICEPDHPYQSDPYPIDSSDVDYGYCQSSGYYYAKCGPRKRPRTPVSYSVDKAYMNNVSTERRLAVLTHEVTHITEGSHSDGSTHNPAFWREMMFNAWQVREAWDTVQEHFGPNVDEEQYVVECIEDPNETLVDSRTETVQERKQENAELLGEHDYFTDS